MPLSHCCGLVVAFACGSGACWACWGTFSLRSWPDFWRVWRVLEGFGAFEAWQTAALNAYKKPLLRPWGALEPLLWPCGGFCVRSGACWACWYLNERGLCARKSSTPAVVPGAAPALAKAGAGGYIYIYKYYIYIYIL